MSVVKTSADRRTRDAVVQRLLSTGPSTAACLAAEFGLSPAAIRRHLDALVADGLVTSKQAGVVGRRTRGRPARIYLLTDAGRQRLPHEYDLLARDALDYLAEHLGAQAVSDFARRRAEAVVDPYRAQLAAAGSVTERSAVLAEALTSAGFAASVEPVGIGEQLCQHHCPVAHVAAQYPQLCEEELAVMTRALGTYAQRLATIARGDSFCTTYIPMATVAPTAASGSARPHAAGQPSGHTAVSVATAGRTTG
jgi:predicted ArsR family transcriptional regulator